jgi:hypothetical protein
MKTPLTYLSWIVQLSMQHFNINALILNYLHTELLSVHIPLYERRQEYVVMSCYVPPNYTNLSFHRTVYEHNSTRSLVFSL